jgi:hypothetical protein
VPQWQHSPWLSAYPCYDRRCVGSAPARGRPTIRLPWYTPFAREVFNSNLFHTLNSKAFLAYTLTIDSAAYSRKSHRYRMERHMTVWASMNNHWTLRKRSWVLHRLGDIPSKCKQHAQQSLHASRSKLVLVPPGSNSCPCYTCQTL